MRLGVTLNPEYVQVEGADSVIGNVVGRCGAETVVTTPAVLAPSEDAAASREPPLDSGAGRDRLLDRPLWGRHWLNIRSSPSFAPERSRYAGLAFQPPEPDDLTDREGPAIGSFLAELKRLGVRTQILVMAAAPPCLRVQSAPTLAGALPVTADGRTVPGRVDANVSLAHPELRAYMTALVGDLVAAYPEMDVLRFDWPEYPPYSPDSLLFDFSDAAKRRGGELGIDAAALQSRVLGLAPRLRRFLATGDLPGDGSLDAVIAAAPVVGELLDYRAALVTDHVRFLSKAVETASRGRVDAAFQCFPEPFNRLSGFDIGAVDGACSDIGVKLYTMHWPMIERAWVERLVALGGADVERCRDAVRRLLETTRKPGHFADVRYPKPAEPHPAEDAVMEAKIVAARNKAQVSTLWAITHAYGPADDVMRRFRAARRASGDAVHVNRYGYMSEAKIAAIEADVAAA